VSARIWTEADIRAQGVRMNGVDACAARYGVGRTKALELLAAGAVDFTVVRCGRRWVATTTSVLAALGLTPDTEMAARPAATTLTLDPDAWSPHDRTATARHTGSTTARHPGAVPTHR
jgi:hypothetical protein